MLSVDEMEKVESIVYGLKACRMWLGSWTKQDKYMYRLILEPRGGADSA